MGGRKRRQNKMAAIYGRQQIRVKAQNKRNRLSLVSEGILLYLKASNNIYFGLTGFRCDALSTDII